jgi:hypothetical protein
LPPLISTDATEDPLPLIRPVSDYEKFSASNTKEQIQNIVAEVDDTFSISKSFIPDKHKKNDPLPEQLPESLKYAIKCFVLSTAARRVRKQIDVHNSMLVHISRFNVWQDQIASLTDAELKFYQRQIDMKSGNLLNELETIWKQEFAPVTAQILDDSQHVIPDLHNYTDPEITPITWKEVKEEIYPAISKMEVRAVHGDKKVEQLKHKNISPLNYFESEEKGVYLSVIAVGGDKLSRGLTLEGLTISYYLRAAKMYDTLMQMGRWFGYRPGYVDLCRIFTSDELIKWYKHITIASEEMRRDFDYMFLLNKTPKQFGLKVRTHPGVLKITAVNKFRYKHIMQLSYSGELEQTYRFKIDRNIFENNYKVTRELIENLAQPVPESINKKVENQKFVWRGRSNYNLVTDFLSSYRLGKEVIDKDKIVDYINAQVKHGNLVDWTIVLINNSTASEGDKVKIAIDGTETIVGLTDRTNISGNELDYEITKANILSGEHEMIDLSDSQIKSALMKTEIDWINLKRDKKPERPSPYRIKESRASKNGLLLIYPLNPDCQFKDPKTKEKFKKRISDVPIIGITVDNRANSFDLGVNA